MLSTLVIQSNGTNSITVVEGRSYNIFSDGIGPILTCGTVKEQTNQVGCHQCKGFAVKASMFPQQS
jgi:hypothetical protein